MLNNVQPYGRKRGGGSRLKIKFLTIRLVNKKKAVIMFGNPPCIYIYTVMVGILHLVF